MKEQDQMKKVMGLEKIVHHNFKNSPRYYISSLNQYQDDQL